MITNFKLGWRKDKPDIRDFKFRLSSTKSVQSVYLAQTYKLPSIYDQQNLGSCTANAIAFLVHFDMLNKHLGKAIGPFRPSRLFIYYFERLLEGTVTEDSGAELRDGIKVITNNGIVSEDAWVYNEDAFAIEPTAFTQGLASNFKALRYERLNSSSKEILVNALMLGYPICFGMSVYESFITDEVSVTGIIPMPKSGEKLLGGHAMSIVGYSKEFDSFIVRNSWGSSWGQKGYCRIPASYLTNGTLAEDFWVVYSLT